MRDPVGLGEGAAAPEDDWPDARRRPSWLDDLRPSLPALAAGLMLVAGVLHMFLVDDHMTHARGAGLFFLAIAAAQMVWALVYLRAPNRTLGLVGIAALAVAPIVLYIVTRVARAPWSAGPEDVDAIGIATQLAQLAAGVALLVEWQPALPAAQTRAAIGVGMLVAVSGYGGAMASESVAWLGQPEIPHSHGFDDAHAEGGAHADHADGDVHVHGVSAWGTRGESAVGSVDYFGPKTGAAINQHCRAVGHDEEGCWLHFLKDLLTAEGSVPAFDRLQELMAANSQANAQSHPLAHVLGSHAYYAYGWDIEETLAECSYDVFQGCLHGALQAYFNDLAAQGLPLDRAAIEDVCSKASSRFQSYACLHGVGHGVMIHTNYALHESLDLCYLLDGWFAQGSCYGGVFMENVVAYHDSLDPDYVPHNHGSGEPPTYWVDDDDPAYPCNVVGDRYKGSCWRMQTSLILRANHGDFQAAAKICDEAEPYNKDCYASLGRDAPPWSNRNPTRMAQMCSYGDEEEQEVCVKAFTSGVILQDNTPQAGLELCPEIPEDYRPYCYRETGRQAAGMLGDGAAAFCDGAPEAYAAACHEGRQ